MEAHHNRQNHQTLKRVRNYYVQILTYVALINNCISSYWMGNDRLSTSLSGVDGWPNYYHYWLIFDYRSQLMLYLIGIYLCLKYPLKDFYKEFAMKSVLMYIMIFIAEIAVYLWYGNDARNEELYYIYIGLYTIGLYVVAIKEKLW